MVDKKQQRAADCIAQHIKTFGEQSLSGIRADFGAPCTECQYIRQCDYEWYDIMKPILENSNVKISTDLSECI